MLPIFALVVGILIGLIIDAYLNKRMKQLDKEIISNLEKLVRGKDEVIELHGKCYKDLAEAYDNCQEGILITINENIDLKKKLSKVNK